MATELSLPAQTAQTEPAPTHHTPAHPGHTLAHIARIVERAVATTDLSLSQYRVLATLGEGQEAASRLAEKLAVSRPSITGVVDGLVARGLVQRRADASDARRTQVAITTLGRAALDADRAAREGWLGEAIARLSDEEQRTLQEAVELLKRLTEAD